MLLAARLQAMVLRSSSRMVTIVRAAGTSEELRWDVQMGGDFDSKALFQPADRVKVGDEIHCDVFDIPRIVERVKPILLGNGEVAHWDAKISPRPGAGDESRAKRSHAVPDLDAQPPHDKMSGASVGPLVKVPAATVGQGAPDPAVLSPGREFPRFIYHSAQPSRMVSSAREEAELGPEWSRYYIHQEYPKIKYHWSGKTVTVKTLDEEVGLGGGWADSPSAFEPYLGQRPVRTEDQDPTKWLPDWSVPGLTAEQRRKINAVLLRADATFDRSPNADTGAMIAMRQAFDAIAQVLFDSGILTEQVLQMDLPRLIWESAICACWWRFASESRNPTFPERMGRYWIWRSNSAEAQSLFLAETREWRAALLDAGIETPKVVHPAIVAVGQESTPLSGERGEGPSDPPSKRGRKAKFSRDQLEAANKLKLEGKRNNEVAKILYATITPTPAQRRSVPTTLKHHFGSKK
jgi:hypothetical protein